MASQQKTVDYLIEQTADAGTMTAKKMFGEFALYCDSKVVAFVCDDQLFLKPTQAARDYLGTVTEGEAYPGSKPYFVIDGDHWDDAEWMAQLIRISAAELPMPKAKKSPKPR